MVIWDRKMLHPDMTIGEVPGTFYGLTANGWMDQELFENWLKSHFSTRNDFISDSVNEDCSAADCLSISLFRGVGGRRGMKGDSEDSI